MTLKLTYPTIGKRLIAEVPEFSRIYNDHIQEYGEVLPHVLFGDFTRFVIEMHHQSKEDQQFMQVFRRSLDFIEELFLSGDEKLKELASASFLENLHQAGQHYIEIKKHLGKKSLRQLRVIEGLERRL